MTADSQGEPAGSYHHEDHMIGQNIGHYEIEKLLGQGGMGIVYLANRVEDFKKQVAIKFIKHGMDTAEFLRRFENERNILAALRDPKIVGILDAGSTEDGRLYFVMEYVEGKRIDVYCDEHKLSVRKRLNLFLSVLDAVASFHPKFLHRDLKPTNILVTEDEVPILMDFGIAKLTEPDSPDGTQTENRLLTLLYASPEQVCGEPNLNAESDLYSLGVILYELLTGRRPYDLKGKSRIESERIVCETEPKKPSTILGRTSARNNGNDTKTLTSEDLSQLRGCQPSKLRRTLSGDLDTIILFALQKESKRRYKSVEQFSEDIKNYLEYRPLEHAKKPKKTERTWRWCQRHPMSVLITFVVFLLSGIGAWLLMLGIAEEKETLRSSQYVAGLVSSVIHNRLEDLKLAVNEASKDLEKNDELIDKLEKVKESKEVDVTSPNPFPELDELCRKLVKSRIDSNGHPSFDTAAYFNLKGTMLAHSYEFDDPRRKEVIGVNFKLRDYFQKAKDRAKETRKSPVYVSKLFRQKTRSFYKFGIARVIRSESNSGEIIGVLYASITTSRTMGMPRLKDQRYNLVLVGHGDPNPFPGEAKPPENVIVLHPSYLEKVSPNQKLPDPAAFSGDKDQLKLLKGGQYDNYQDPVGGAFEGRWLAGSALVEDTGFVVIVQVKYD